MFRKLLEHDFYFLLACGRKFKYVHIQDMSPKVFEALKSSKNGFCVQAQYTPYKGSDSSHAAHQLTFFFVFQNVPRCP
jgi:hypothetical protein